MSRDEMAATRVAEQVLTSRRYRHVDVALVSRLAADEVERRGTEADAVKRVKRRLYQAIGAYRPTARGGRDHDELAAIRAAWHGDSADLAFRAACRQLLGGQASMRERLPYLDAFYAGIWDAAGGAPASVMDLGCGVGPLALPWTGLPVTTAIHALDADTEQLAIVDAFLSLVGQPHAVEAMDLAATAPTTRADLALLLKLVPLLDRQDARAASRLVAALDVKHAVVSFPRQSLGGRGKGMERTYRRRLAALFADLGDRVVDVREASIPNELVFVLALAPPAVDG